LMPIVPTPEKAPKPTPEKESAVGKAKLIVQVPADAKLYIDDQLMKTTSSKRVFNTPALQRGQQYYYILRAEVLRDGKTYKETKRVLVRAGQEIRATFPQLEDAAIAAKTEAASR
jgi:uncharacterized protein (TIGR03000 family)